MRGHFIIPGGVVIFNGILYEKYRDLQGNFVFCGRKILLHVLYTTIDKFIFWSIIFRSTGKTMAQNTTWANSQTKQWIEHNFFPKDMQLPLAVDSVASAINGQYSAQKDYESRVLLELLQNVDDAALESQNPLNNTAEFILEGNTLKVLNQGKTFDEKSLRAICLGHVSPKQENTDVSTTGLKGIGFRGVLNWSEDIRIYSGDFAVQFSRDQYIKHVSELKNNDVFREVSKKIPDITNKFPILLLPGNTSFPAEWKEGKFNGFYDTCIEIILNEESKKHVRTAIEQFINQEYFSVLFLRALKKLKFTIVTSENDVQETTITISDDLPQETGHYLKNIQILSNTLEPQEISFHMFTEGAESIAVPCNWADWDKKTYAVYSTFSANSTFCPFSVLMNSYDFDLPSDREIILNTQKNVNIIKKLETLLTNVVAPYFAKPEFKTQAIELLSYKELEGSLFLQNKDTLRQNIVNQAIIPTLGGKYRRLNEQLKTLPYNKYPDIILRGDEDLFVCTDVNRLLAFDAILQNYLPYISNKDLYDIINNKSFSWTTKERISVFFFWAEQIGFAGGLMPNLIKNQNNEFYVFDNTNDKQIFFYTGKNIKEMPSWVPFDTIAPDDQQELYIQAKTSNPNLNKEIDRFLTDKYPSIFNYMDKTRLIKEINKNINGDYERSVDLIKCVYYNYKNGEISKSESDVVWHIPTSEHTLSSPNKVFFGSDYHENTGAKICHAAGLVAMPAPAVFGIPEQDKELFCDVISTFFGIRTNILPRTIELHGSEISDGYKTLIVSTIESKYGSINNIEIRVECIPELENILQNADQNLILEWLCQLPLNKTVTINVNFHKNRSSYWSNDALSVPDYTVYQLQHLKWLKINGEKISPIECLLPTKKNKYLGDLVPMVPVDANYNKLWDLLDIQENVSQLPQPVFYNILSMLPDINNGGNIAIQIYNEVAVTPNEQLANLMSDETCSEKSNFLANGKLWAKTRKDKKASFYPISQQVYFTSNKVLNIENKPIMVTPQRRGGVKEFCYIFGAKEFAEDIQASYDKSIRHSENHIFQEEFTNFKKYLLALNATKKLNDALPGLEISLIQDVKIINDSNDIQVDFDDYEVIPTNKANKYFIKLHATKHINNNKLARSIAEICNKISSSGDIRDTVSLLYISDEDDKKQIVFDNGGDITLLTEYKDIKQQFIQTVNNINDKTDVEKLLGTYPIDFEDFESENNVESIIAILNQLNIDVDDFERQGFQYVDLKNYNKQKLCNYIYNNKNAYKSWLYNSLLDKSIEEQTTFFAQIQHFEDLIDQIKIPNLCNFNPEIVVPIQKTTELIDTDKIYSSNLQELMKLCPSEEVLDEILNNDATRSRLVFGQMDVLKNKYDEYINQQEKSLTDEHQYTPDISSNTTLTIHEHKSVIFDETEMNNNVSNHRPSTRRYIGTRSAENKQKAGFVAEQQVYNSLKLQYPDSIEWLSSNAEKANVIERGNGDDRLGYDIRYKDKKGNIQYVEVKNATRLHDDVFSFIISPNEESFALDNLNNYSVFLVVDNDYIERIPGKKLKEYLKRAIPEAKKCIIPLKNKVDLMLHKH